MGASFACIPIQLDGRDGHLGFFVYNNVYGANVNPMDFGLIKRIYYISDFGLRIENCISPNCMSRCTHNFMSIWRCHKPVIARVHGDAVAGGSDISLYCDIIIMNEKARIGYPPSRVWGCPTTAMWVYRLGAEKAKQMLFTGDLISGTKAQEIGLIFQSVPLEELDETVNQLTNRIKGVPKNQLMMMKMMVNQAYENMGLASTQTIATLFDGVARHSPEGIWFKQRTEEVGFKQAVAERDSGDPIPGSKK